MSTRARSSSSSTTTLRRALQLVALTCSIACAPVRPTPVVSAATAPAGRDERASNAVTTRVPFPLTGSAPFDDDARFVLCDEATIATVCAR
jgi:hypothetical protein